MIYFKVTTASSASKFYDNVDHCEKGKSKKKKKKKKSKSKKPNQICNQNNDEKDDSLLIVTTQPIAIDEPILIIDDSIKGIFFIIKKSYY